MLIYFKLFERCVFIFGHHKWAPLVTFNTLFINMSCESFPLTEQKRIKVIFYIIIINLIIELLSEFYELE